MELAATSKYQDKSTLWGNVSLEFIKSTPIWKHYQDDFGRIPHSMYSGVLKSILQYLGMDLNSDHGFTQSKAFIRDNRNNTKGIKTILFTFPVRHNYHYKNMYINKDILSAPASDSIRSVDLSNYGTQYWCESEHQRNKKKQTREQLLDSILAGSV